MALELEPQPFALVASGPLAGDVAVPGDKSISHRALILSALAVGRSRAEGLLESEDVLRTATALRHMGAGITRTGPGCWEVDGVGVGGLLQPETALDMGNSGTSARLLMGLVAAHDLVVTFIGDKSLSRRPMGRVATPLEMMGAEIRMAPGDRLPLTVRGLAPALPITYRLPIASAQVKSAVLLAGLNAAGTTTVIEPVATRDHSERMLALFGAAIRMEAQADGSRAVLVDGPAELRPHNLVVPGDPSSAAFPIVAALLVPGSRVTVRNVGLNPTRDGLLRMLDAMGARIARANFRNVGNEPVADLVVEASELTGIEVPPSLAPTMIDEFPALFVAASLARGQSRFRGLEELRVKESDRLSVMAEGLRAAGVPVVEHADGLDIEGTDGTAPAGGARIDPRLDHRIAMSFALLSLRCRAPLVIADRRPIATSFPDFLKMMQELGAELRTPVDA
ncbi:3-phosphoshikimate 1-carboxyvinyltransferase [Thermaurantiacus sp.]